MSALQFATSDLVSWSLNKPVDKPLKYVREKINWYQAINQGPYVNAPCNFHKTAGGEVLDFSRAEVAMPCVIQCTQQGVVSGSVGASASLSSPMFIGLKPGGTLNLVDRVVFQLNGSTIGNQQTLQPIYANLKYIFGTAESYHKTMGPKYLMGSRLPADEVLSYSNIGTVATGVISSLNANITNTPGSATKPQDIFLQSFFKGSLGCNKALWSRCINLGQPKNTDPGTTASTSISSAVQTRVSYTATVNNIANGSAIVQGAPGVYCNFWAMIPLAKVSDVFRGLGIRTWVDFNLALYMNSCYGVNCAAGGAGASNPLGNQFLAQNYCPLMITQSGATTYATANVEGAIAGQQSAGLSLAGNIYQAGLVCGLGDGGNFYGPVNGNGLGGGGNAYQPQNVDYAQLWIPEYQLDDEQMAQFLSAPRSTLGFFDYFLINNFTNIGLSQTVNHILNGTLTSPRKVYMLVFPTASSLNGGNASAITQCTSFEPLYSTANLAVGNWNVKINGVPIYPLNIQWQYQDWINNTQENLLLNAGLVPQLGGSLVTKDFIDTSKCYVADLSRYVLPATPVPVTVTWQNQSPCALDVLYIVENYYEALVEQSATAFSVKQMPSEV